MPLIEPDRHPNVRASVVCPLCRKVKPVGNVACWPCYRVHDLRYGNPDAEMTIDEVEQSLKGES